MLHNKHSVVLLAAGMDDRALRTAATIAPSSPTALASAAASATAGQPTAATVAAEPAPQLVPLSAGPNTPAASVDAENITSARCGPAVATAPVVISPTPESKEAKQLQRRQAVAQFKVRQLKVRLLETAPSPVPAPAGAVSAAKAVPAHLGANATVPAVAPQPVDAPAAAPGQAVPGAGHHGSWLPSTTDRQGGHQAAAQSDAPAPGGAAAAPLVAASPSFQLPAPDAKPVVWPARHLPSPVVGRKAVAASTPMPPTPTQDSRAVPKVLLSHKVCFVHPTLASSECIYPGCTAQLTHSPLRGHASLIPASSRRTFAPSRRA